MISYTRGRAQLRKLLAQPPRVEGLMQSNPDFADDYFCLPPLDILVAVQADENIHRLADRLKEDCHHVTLVGHLPDKFAEVDAHAPEVLLVESSTAAGVALARRVRAGFHERIVIVGLSDGNTPSAFARLFDYLLPRPVEYVAFAQALGLVPEADSSDLAAGIMAIAGSQQFQPEGWRKAA